VTGRSCGRSSRVKRHDPPGMALAAALLFAPGRVDEKDVEGGEALIVILPVHVRSELRLPVGCRAAAPSSRTRLVSTRTRTTR
jgi:hypothetical protein